MVLIALLAEGLDLATYQPAFEVNPIVLGLGPNAPLAKALLLVSIAAIAFVLGRVIEHPPQSLVLPLAWISRTRTALLRVAIVAGVFGAWSNLA